MSIVSPPTGSQWVFSEVDDELWKEMLVAIPRLADFAEQVTREPAEFDIYCRLAHWYGYADRRGRGVKERWGTMWEASTFRHNSHSYDIGYRKLNDLLPWCDEGCGC